MEWVQNRYETRPNLNAKHVFILKDIPLLECALSFKLFVNMQEVSLYWFAAQYQAVTFRQKKTCFAWNLVQKLLILVLISKRNSKWPKNGSS